jgi:hypothetical protein
MDLPLPGEVEVIVNADGSKTLQPIASAASANSFSCDSPNS